MGSCYAGATSLSFARNEGGYSTTRQHWCDDMRTETLVERQARAAAGSEPEPTPAEALFLFWLGGAILGAASVLAWARYWWRLV